MMARDSKGFVGPEQIKLASAEVELSQQLRNRGQQTVVVDTRGAKKLDPVRLPSKLRERVEKAQRRAVAAKDGVSIFTASAGDSVSSMGGSASMADLRPRTSVSSLQRSASMLNIAYQPHDARANQPVLGAVDPDRAEDANAIKTKSHLPQVVLRHKMREFEAKMNASSVLADPLEASGGLNRLSIEDKERVMARMQEKIRSITDEIEADFIRIRRELDAHGVFDEAANYQRAQTMCLVELQRRCRLEKIRDESIDEIMGVKKSSDARRLSSAFLYSTSSIASTKQIEKSLTEMLHSPQKDHSKINKTQQHRHTISQGKKRVGALPKLARELRPNTVGMTSSSLSKFEATSSDSVNRVSSAAPVARQGRKLEREFLNELGGAQEASDELWGRHQHVIHAIQVLSSGKEPTKDFMNSDSGSARASGDLEMESDRRLSPADEWRERSVSYRVIAQRTLDELWARSERSRWDSTGHFSSPSAFNGSNELIKRLEMQQAALLRSFEGSGVEYESKGREEREIKEAVDESLSTKRQRASEQYVQLQAQIVERLSMWNAQPTPSPTMKRRLQRQIPIPVREDVMMSGSGADNDQSTKVSPAIRFVPVSLTRSSSSASVLLNQSAEEDKQVDRQESPSDCPESTRVSELTPSISMPALDPTEFLSPPSKSIPAFERPGTRHRLSLLERRLLARQQLENEGEISSGWLAGQRGSMRASRRGFRRESRIGAPSPATDFATFGRHSDARMAERRYSAQTWIWLASESPEDDQDESGSSEDDGELDGMVLEEGDEEEEDEEGTEEGISYVGGDRFASRQLKPRRSGLESIGDEDDETGSEASYPFTPQSARSSNSVATTTLSISSKKTARNSGDRRHRASKRRAQKTNKGATRHAVLSGDALNLHTRLEMIWKSLEFPFSHKLLMVEKYAEVVDDPNAFEKALSTWEVCAYPVVVRERMKRSLIEFSEKHELKADTRLAADEVAALNTAIKESGGGARGIEEGKNLRLVDPSVVLALSTDNYIKWVQDSIGEATAWCLRAARLLKDATGDELEFQGLAYPPRSISGAVKDT